MKLHTALFAAVLLAAGAGAAMAAPSEPATKNWIVGLRRGAAAEPAPSLRNRPVRRFQSVDAYAVAMTEQEANELRSSGDVRYVEPDYPRYLYGGRPVPGPRRTSWTSAVTASAPARSATQSVPYGIDLIRARTLWQYGRGAGIKVGVIDTGIDYNHPDLKSIYKGGKDFINNDADPMDDHGHGTHVAGTIAAANNQIGVVGVAPEIDLYALKVLAPKDDGSAQGSVTAIVAAIDFAIENKINVLNLSLGSDEQSITEKEAFARAWDAGILSIAASGNGYDDLKRDFIGFPAAYPNVVAVGAIDKDEGIASFSQRGAELALVAPGISVLSSLPVGSGVIADVAVDDEFLPEVGTPDGTPMGEASAGFVFCALGKTGEFPASVAGKIALIKRGDITFNEKARNAKAAGAIGVVIFNHDNTALNWTLIRNDETGKPIADDLPLTVAISKSEGDALVAKPSARVSIAVSPYDYGILQGTSMATPHVAGVAALVWSLAPESTAAQVRNAITTTGRDIGDGGWDTVFGFGVVDALRAA
ncbi:MAG TPA: S8 family serine peptidase, partial [Thermoanaerobaculia bacterium]